MKRFLIVGGSDAGISAALRAREVDPSWRVTVVVADAFPNYSICGLPFFLSGETPRAESLAHRTRSGIEYQGIELLLDTEAERVRREGTSCPRPSLRWKQRGVRLRPPSASPRERSPPGRRSEVSTRPPSTTCIRWRTASPSSTTSLRESRSGPSIVERAHLGVEMADAFRHRLSWSRYANRARASFTLSTRRSG